MYTYQTDVLVIGGGGGGAMAAYEASKHGVEVMMVMKGQSQRCGSTIMAPGAIAGVGQWHVRGDSRDLHFQDTIKGGSYLGEQGLVRVMVEEAPDLILEMEKIGALWEREEDGRRYALRTGGGHSYPRCTFLEDRTGREMLRTLMGTLKKRRVSVLPQVMVLRLLKEENRVTGAVGLKLDTSEPVALRARCIVLACGGAGNLYQNTDNPTDVTGDGYALALQAGAELMDMEFVQFFPLGFCFPHSLKGALAGLPYYVHLRNNLGERFMEQYDPERLELSTRDRVSRAIFSEIKAGRGGPHGGVFADMTYHEPGFIARMQPALYETYRKIGIDPEKHYLEMAPTCHFLMGGARVDENWASTLPGLFIVGETAAGIQGANRLSQNALAELLVSGTRAGRWAARFCKDTALPAVDPREAGKIVDLASSMFERSNGIRPITLRKQLQRLMWERAGIYRTESGLRSALAELKEMTEELKRQFLPLKSRRHNRELVEGLENHFLTAAARCVVEAALERRETRGAHFREDYPKTDNRNWLKHLVIRQTDGRLKIDYTLVDMGELTPEEGTA